ncbi:MAG: endonuclease domain-containing protein [Agrobacterium tumefaciens]
MSKQAGAPSEKTTAHARLWSVQRQRHLFSPAGRRWRVAPDEGGRTAMTHPQDPTKRLPGRTSKARELRANDTEAEYRLWSDLRNRRLNGYKFSRQIPLGPYIVDFVCREQSLIVELDGSQHAESTHDERRTEWLNQQGYSVLRFWNAEILQERRAVLETILAVLQGQIVERCDAIRFSPVLRGDR